jgi:hypothetical protein
MADDSPAKVWSDQRDLPIYLGDAGDGFRLPGKEHWRAPDAIAALTGLSLTAILVTFNLDSGNALSILVLGVVVTVAAVAALSKLPATRPSLATRLHWFQADLRPQVSCSHPALAAEEAEPR